MPPTKTWPDGIAVALVRLQKSLGVFYSRRKRWAGPAPAPTRARFEPSPVVGVISNAKWRTTFPFSSSIASVLGGSRGGSWGAVRRTFEYGSARSTASFGSSSLAQSRARLLHILEVIVGDRNVPQILQVVGQDTLQLPIL